MLSSKKQVEKPTLPVKVSDNLFRRLLRMTMAERTRLYDLLKSLDDKGWKTLRVLINAQKEFSVSHFKGKK